MLCSQNVRYWHLADIGLCAAHVRFRGLSGQEVLQCKCPLLTQSGHATTRSGDHGRCYFGGLTVRG
jgi:hypothetical protein